MKIGFVVNEFAAKEAKDSSSLLAGTVVNLGHAVWTLGTGDHSYDADDNILARGCAMR